MRDSNWRVICTSDSKWPWSCDIYEPKGISQKHMDPLGAGDLVHRDADDEGKATGKALCSRALRDLCSRYMSMLHPGKCLFF